MNYQNYEEYMRNVLGYSPYPEKKAHCLPLPRDVCGRADTPPGKLLPDKQPELPGKEQEIPRKGS